MRKLSLRICPEFNNLGSAFFKSQQQLFAIFYVIFCSIFGSFAIFNLNGSLIFNDGSRYGSVTRNLDQLIQVQPVHVLEKIYPSFWLLRLLQIILEPNRALTSASRGKFWTADWKAVTADLIPPPNMACCRCWWLSWRCFTNFPYDFPMVPLWFLHVSPMVPQVFL